jgi:uncharacterized protein (TIGR02270 family)
MIEKTPVLWSVVEEHLDEAMFGLGQWSAALDSPTYDLDTLAKTVEARTIAHLDALAVGGPEVADALLWPSLGPDADDEQRAAAATAALLIGPGTDALDRVLDQLCATPGGPVSAGIVSALSSAPRLDLAARALALAERVDDPAPLVEIAAARGGVPGTKTTAWIPRAARSEEPRLRMIAARVSAALPRAQGLPIAEHLVRDADEQVALAALATALVCGSPSAQARALELAKTSCASSRAARAMLAVTGEREHVQLLVDLLAREGDRAEALWALGFCGRVDVVDRLLPWLDDGDAAALAAEAIGGITGLGHRERRFWREGEAQPEVTDADIDGPLADEDLDASLEHDPTDELPQPIPAVFRDAWPRLRERVDPRIRFHYGRPLAHTSDYAGAIAQATCRRRHVIAFELAIRTRGLCRVATRTFTSALRHAIDAVANAGPVDGARPYARIS